jgi:hypothetical protein
VFKLKTGAQFNWDTGKFCHALSAENQVKPMRKRLYKEAIKEVN